MEKINIVDVDISKISKEAKEATKDVGKLNKTLNDVGDASKSIDQATNSIEDLSRASDLAVEHAEDIARTFTNVTDVAAGLMGGVQAVEGALQLMGVESEEVTVAIQKMQAMMAITDGIKYIGDAGVAFAELRKKVLANLAATKIDTVATNANATSKGLLATITNKATAATKKLTKSMLKNPWTAIALAITAAATAMYSWITSSKKAKEAQKKLDDQIKLTNESLQHQSELWDFEARKQAAGGKSEVDILQYRIEAAEKAKRIAWAAEEAVKKDAAHTQEQLDKAREEVKKWETKETELRQELSILKITKGKEAADKAKEDLKEARKEYKDELEALKKEAQESFLAPNEKEKKEIIDHYKDIIATQKQYYDEGKITASEYKDFVESADEAMYAKLGENIKIFEKEQSDARHGAIMESIARSQEAVDYAVSIEQKNRDVALSATEAQDAFLNSLGRTVDALIEKSNTLKLLQDQLKTQTTEWIDQFSEMVDMSYFDNFKDKYKSLNDDFAQRLFAMIDMLNIEKNAAKEVLSELDTKPIAEQDPAEREELIANIDRYDQSISLLEDYRQQILDTKVELNNLVTEETLAKLDETREIIQGTKDAFSELNSIASGVSDQWGAVFDSMLTGLDKVQTAVQKGGKGWTKYGQMASAGLHVASSMMLAIADEQNEATEEGFEKQKKLQIAAATMSMLGGIIDAWTSAMSPANKWMTIWGQVAAGTVTSAMIAATGAMQIKAIKRQKMDGSGGEDSLGATANPAIAAIANLNSGVSATTDIQGASVEGKVEDQRVYVVESDITRSQHNVKTAVDEATY